MGERPGMIPPRRGLPPRPPVDHRAIARRRVLAAGLLAVVLGLVAWVGLGALGGGGSSQQTTAAPAPPVLRIVFPEGFTRAEMAARITAVRTIARRKRGVTPKLTARAYLAATAKLVAPLGFRKDAKGRGSEGFLFPSTYEFVPATTVGQLVADQLVAFRETWAKVDLRYARKRNLTAYDVLIIASMVEKETVAPDERPLVAAVVYNRLKARMPLGIDATIRYGLHVPATKPLRVSQLRSDSPYNTRTRRGLPPTPIANPGLASLQAAAHPAKVDYLYFVRKPDRIHHFFTASEQEFLKKACEYGYGCD
jgi:UPF0755 protein